MIHISRVLYSYIRIAIFARLDSFDFKLVFFLACRDYIGYIPGMLERRRVLFYSSLPFLSGLNKESKNYSTSKNYRDVSDSVSR